MKTPIIVSTSAFLAGLLFSMVIEKEEDHSDTTSSKLTLNTVSPTSKQKMPVAQFQQDTSQENYAQFSARMQKELTSEEMEKIFDELFSSSISDFDPKMSLLLQKWGEIAPKSALEKIKNNKGSIDWAYPVFMGWAKKNPEAAATYYSESRDRYVKNNFLVLVAISTQWTMYSPQNTWDWLQTQNGKTIFNREFQYCKDVVINTLAENSPEKIPQFLEKLNMEDKERNAYALGEKWASAPVAGTDEWMGQLSEKGTLKAKAGQLMASSQGDLNEIQKSLSQFDEETQKKIIKELAYPLLETGNADIKDRISWLMDSMPNALSNFGIKRRINDWISEDKIDATKWIHSLPEGENKKQLLKLGKPMH